jgi:hypothetical protein
VGDPRGRARTRAKDAGGGDGRYLQHLFKVRRGSRRLKLVLSRPVAVRRQAGGDLVLAVLAV